MSTQQTKRKHKRKTKPQRASKLAAMLLTGTSIGANAAERQRVAAQLKKHPQFTDDLGFIPMSENMRAAIREQLVSIGVADILQRLKKTSSDENGDKKNAALVCQLHDKLQTYQEQLANIPTRESLAAAAANIANPAEIPQQNARSRARRSKDPPPLQSEKHHTIDKQRGQIEALDQIMQTLGEEAAPGELATGTPSLGERWASAHCFPQCAMIGG